jgi:hypothetical protein
MESALYSFAYCKCLRQFLIVTLVFGSDTITVIRASAADAPVEFPITTYPDLVFATVTIERGEHLFAIDSGSTGNVFHTSLRRYMGNSHGVRNVESANGHLIALEEFDAPAAQIGTIELKEDASAVCHDLSSVREAEGREVEGIIGIPLFRRCIVQMDFDSHRLSIFPASIAPKSDWGEPLNVLDNGAKLPTIRLAFDDGVNEQCIVDTGFSGAVSLNSKVYQNLFKRRLIVAQGENSFALFHGLQTVQQGRLHIAKIGSFEKNDLLVTNGDAESRIGLKYLRLFRVTFDLSRNRIYFAKGHAFDKTDKQAAIGVGVLRKQAKTVVVSVEPKSPADKAGILVDDELLSVAGQSIAGRPLAEVRWMLRDKADEQGRLSLTLGRGSAHRDVLVNIRD